MSSNTEIPTEKHFTPGEHINRNSLPLLASLVYGETHTSEMLNSKELGLKKPGIYAGFNVVPIGPHRIKVAMDESLGYSSAMIELGLQNMTILQQRDIELDVPNGTSWIVVLEGFYQHGVPTTQVSLSSDIDAASIKLITEQELVNTHLILADIDLTDSPSTISMSDIDESRRVERVFSIDDHVDDPNPHPQYMDGSSVAVPAGFPIREIPNSIRVDSSSDISIPDDFVGKCIYLTGCGGGGGGGGYHDGVYNSASWGGGGAGGASGFRIPLAAKAGDIIRITVGAGGSAATNAVNSEGGDGGSTIAENITAINENRFGQLTKFIARITLNGGNKGSYNKFSNKASVIWKYALGGIVDGIYDKFANIGCIVEGGQGGRGGAYYGIFWGNGNTYPNGYAYGKGTSGEIVSNIKFDNLPQTNVLGKDGGGAGGTLFSGDDLGTGGKGKSSEASATKGKDGFALLEWD